MDKATELFVEKLGLKFEADGQPRIAGRVLAYLMVCREAQSLDDLADVLRVSKGSVSTNARLLELHGVVERVTRPGDRRDYYRISDDLHVKFMDALLNRLREMRDLLEVALLAPPAEDPVVRDRIEAFAAFFGDMLDAATASEAQWQAQKLEPDRRRTVAGL